MALQGRPDVASSPRQQWGLQGYWFAFNFQGAALLTIVVPETVLRFSTRHSTTLLAEIATLVALAAMVMSPITGSWSDRQKRRRGGRMGLLWWGTGFNVAGLALAAVSPSFVVLSGCIIVAVLGQTTAQSAFQAMMPEVVARERWGRASGYMGLASLTGSIAGLAAAGLLPMQAVYLIMVGTALAGAGLTHWAVPQRAPANRREHAVIRSHDIFVRVFIARFALMFGQTLLMTYVLFFFRSVLKISRPAAGTAAVAGLAMGGAVVSSVVLGIFSDRLPERSRLVAAAGAPMAIAALGFALRPDPGYLPLWAICYGLGYGAVLSVDWALALDSIPDLGNVARDLGFWGIASGLPPVIAPGVGGWILAWAIPLPLRYRVLFLAAGLAFILASLVVLTARSRPRRMVWSAPLVALVATILWVYTRLRYRVRVTGTIGRAPGSLLLVANHAHDLEGMVLPVALVRHRGLSRPVVSAGSARIFEPGFLTDRVPGRWAVALAPINVASIVGALGVRPIEDRPLSRPMASWAYLFFRHFGNILLRDAFLTAELPIGIDVAARLSAAWSMRWVKAFRRDVTITALTPPYRTWVRKHFRDQVEADMAVFAQMLSHGAAVYTTPEGKFTQDGRLNRFRSSLAPMQDGADAVAVAGVSYDVFRRGRLRMWVHWGFPRWPARLEDSVIVARRVTASHLVVMAWRLCPHLDETSLMADALRLKDTILGQAVLADDLRTHPERALMEALVVLRNTFAKKGAAVDARFPYVPDFATYYENQWAELMSVLGSVNGPPDTKPRG